MKYKIVSTKSQQDMEEVVQRWLDEGWELYGNIVMVIQPLTGSLIYYREMVMFGDDPDAMMWEIPVVRAEEVHAN